MEPEYRAEARRAASRTAIVTLTVMAVLFTAGDALLVWRDVSHHRSIGFLWTSVPVLLLWVVVLSRGWAKDIRARRSGGSHVPGGMPPTAVG